MSAVACRPATSSDPPAASFTMSAAVPTRTAFSRFAISAGRLEIDRRRRCAFIAAGTVKRGMDFTPPAVERDQHAAPGADPPRFECERFERRHAEGRDIQRQRQSARSRNADADAGERARPNRNG